ncbi:MAG: hypothetical protein AB2L24_11630 [Mangrovibacterium sp.]
MNSKLNFRSVVFQRTYRIVKQTGCSFSQALIQAWQRYREFKARTITELADQINGFDFYYYMSDDYRVNRRWSNIKDQIRKQISNLPGSFIAAITSQLSNVNYIQSFI